MPEITPDNPYQTLGANAFRNQTPDRVVTSAPEDRSWWQKATGRGKFIPGLPELNTSVGVGAKLGLARDDQSMVNILEKQVGSRIETKLDPWGSVIVTLTPEQAQKLGTKANPRTGLTFYVDQRGLSGRDIAQFTESMGVELPFYVGGGGLAANIGKKALTRTGGKMAGAGIGAGLGYEAQNAWSRSHGSQYYSDPLETTFVVLFGGLFEGAGIAANKAFRSMRQKGWITISRGKSGSVSDIKISDEGYEAIAKATGTDVALLKEAKPTELLEEYQKQLAKMGGEKRGGQDLAAVEAARKQGGIPLTKGQITRDPETLNLEDQLRQGTWGETAKQRALTMDQAQQRGLRQGLTKLEQQMGGSNSMKGSADELTIGGPADMARARSGILARSEGEKKRIADLYRNAEKMARPAQLQMEQARKFTAALGRMVLREGWKEKNKPPAVRAALDQLESMMQSGKSVSVFELERWLQSLNLKIRGTQGVEKDMLVKMRGMYDDFMDSSTGFLFGGKGAVNAFRNARAARREYAKVFEDDPKLMKLIERDQMGEMRLNDTEALDVLFGKGGASPARGSANTINRIKSMLGENSREWGDFKVNVLRRIMQSHKNAPETGPQMQRMFSGDRFTTALMRLKENDQVYKSIFTAKERYGLESLASIARRITSRPPDPGNPSKTFTNLSAAMRAWMARNNFEAVPIINLFADMIIKSWKWMTTGNMRGRGLSTKLGMKDPTVGYTVHGARRAMKVDPRTGKVIQELDNDDFIGPLGTDRITYGLGLSRHYVGEGGEMWGGYLGTVPGAHMSGEMWGSRYNPETYEQAQQRRNQQAALDRLERELEYQQGGY